jgi:hypothetical protein
MFMRKVRIIRCRGGLFMVVAAYDMWRAVQVVNNWHASILSRCIAARAKKHFALSTYGNGRGCSLRSTDSPPNLSKPRRADLCPLPRENQGAEDEAHVSCSTLNELVRIPYFKTEKDEEYHDVRL